MRSTLKELRKALGLTQKALAREIEATQTVICNWETGVQAIPVSRVIQICQTFNVNRSWLETGEGEMFNSSNNSNPITNEEAFVSTALSLIKLLPHEKQELFLSIAKRLIIGDEDPAEYAKEALEKAKAKKAHEADKRQTNVETNNGIVTGDITINHSKREKGA